ncbi:conserved hypothetical protein [Xenorhabdus bovienii str. kraussei Quebec]|uniref:Inner membrane protein yafU n=1 Tax=Xenorhabdus bovienii str. kraussei Quebec TaxID=1398203 RepID=A0A077PL31_XENBV|nr:hypothetical protein [Xenorhabdus bovienii]CDH21758.1 conserved hypothetical protein [Xenorhabdus bovienii str. kraussei Quebec]
MDIKRQNELLNFHLGGIVQIDKADGILKPRENTSQAIEQMIKQLDKNTELYVLLTLEEAVDAVKNLCGPNPNASWKDGLFSCSDIATSFTGSFLDAYALAKIANELSGHFGVKATQYIDKYGNKSIKLTGRPGVRKFLTAAKYSVNNLKMIDMGIGSKGLVNGIVDGARRCIIVAGAYRLLELWLRDEYDIHNFLGNITMDMAKAIVSISATLIAGKIISTAYVLAGVSLIGVAIGLFVFGLVVASVLYYLDDKYQVSAKLIEALRNEK